MSGPKTLNYEIEDTIRRARNLKRSEDERRRMEGLFNQIANMERQIERLQRAVADTKLSFPGESINVEVYLPTRTSSTQLADLETYHSQLQQIVINAEGRLHDAVAQATANTNMKAMLVGIVEGLQTTEITVGDVLDQSALLAVVKKPGRNEQQVKERQELASRIIGRLATERGATIPSVMEALIHELVNARDDGRAEALAMELRQRVQKFNEERGAIENERNAASVMLNAIMQLGGDAPEQLIRELQMVLMGQLRLAPDLRLQAESFISQKHASHVTENVLKELGYEVESEFASLFVDGGVVYFQRPGWEDYHVCLYVNPEKGSMNFNVVREAIPTESTGAEQKKRDTEMEKEWCSDIKALMEKLAEKGVNSRIKREIPVGAHPVDVVSREEIESKKTVQKTSVQARMRTILER